MQTLPETLETKPVSTKETGIGIIILMALAAVAAGVFFSQYRMNPALRMTVEPSTRQPSETIATPEGALGGTLAMLPQGLSIMTPAESFNVHTLSDKIDGKAELYLSAGFRGLRTQRFSLANAPHQWVELFAYDMGKPGNAFSVFSMQRREDAVPLDLTPHAYLTENGVFAVHGPYYLEVIGSGSSRELTDAAQAAVRGFAAETRVKTAGLNEPELFPVQDLHPESITLLSSDVFGFEGLDRVYTAAYRTGEGEVTAFISRREDVSAAARLADSYYRFLLENGGKPLPDMTGISGARVVDILGGVEIIFNEGPVFAGIHDAPGRGPAESLALRLKRGLAEAVTMRAQ